MNKTFTALILICMTGCASLSRYAFDDGVDPDVVPLVYGGVALDWYFITGPGEGEGYEFADNFIRFFGVIDMPFSFAADTLLLPVSIPMEKSIESRLDQQRGPTVKTGGLLSDENLSRLPPRYQPATFSYDTKQLAVPTNLVVIPDMIWKRFGDTRKDPLNFIASWRTQEDAPSILIHNSSFHLFLYLDTLEIQDVLRHEKLTSDCLKKWKVTEI